MRYVSRRAFTLLELSLVLGLIATLSGLVVHGYGSYRRQALVNEAYGNVQAIYALQAGRPGGPLPCSAWPEAVPAMGAVPWSASDAFADLGFSVRGETRFQYEVLVEDTEPASERHFVVIASGDLDGDGETSEIRLSSRRGELEVARPLE
jgi:prepilin-type N-terminal cleavage/methylation domain-containing protein